MATKTAGKKTSTPTDDARSLAGPVFAQPEPTEDPGTFRVPHKSDKEAYNSLAALRKAHALFATPFPAPRGGLEPQLTLTQALGVKDDAVKAIERSGQIVFHATGDCGSTKGPTHQNEVTDKMVEDFHGEAHNKEKPSFNLLLGDVVYSFGEVQYYYDQFYEPYRDYAAPIFAVAGNHDGMVAPGTKVDSLFGFLRNFCADHFRVMPEAGGLSRTAQIQPGVFYTLEAPFVRILALYSNSLEDPGVIADKHTGDSQLKFLAAALARVKRENYKGALLMAMHHPPYTASHSGGRHGGSPEMLAQIDRECERAGVWPHALLAGHVHNYQRFTRQRADGSEIPYISCGNGGHNVQSLTRKGNPPLRVPQVIEDGKRGADRVVFENYDDQHYGYLRVIANARQLRIEYHSTAGGPNKSPDDSVTIDLATRKRAAYHANDLGWPKRAAAARAKRR